MKRQRPPENTTAEEVRKHREMLKAAVAIILGQGKAKEQPAKQQAA
jgi:hypothetical protein